MSRYFLFFIVVAGLLISSCATYHITTASLQQQLAGTPMEQKENLLIPINNINGNSLTTITVLDKKGQEKVIPVTRHTGVRITQKDGKKKTFYFNTLQLTDSSITGSTTHLFNAKIKPILFVNVSKIELQK